MIKHHHHSQLVRSVVLVTLASVLVWQVITKSFAAYLANEAPEAALNFDSSEPVALVTLAEARVKSALTEGGSAAVSVSEQASIANSQISYVRRDRIGAWAELALRAAGNRLQPGNTLRSPTGERARQPNVP